MNPGFLEVLKASPDDRRDLFLGTARQLGTPEQYVEKDFWVVGPKKMLTASGTST